MTASWHSSKNAASWVSPGGSGLALRPLPQVDGIAGKSGLFALATRPFASEGD